MAKCSECNQEMLKVETCTIKQVSFLDGKLMERNSEYFDLNDRCHDCGIVNKKGNYHHFGCDVERCPRCSEQMLGHKCEIEIN